MNRAVALALAVVTTAAPVRAEIGAPLGSSGCDAALVASVARSLAIELDGVPGDPGAALASGTIVAEIECDDAGTTARVRRGDTALDQRIEAGEPGHARRLALALAELVEALLPSAEPPEPPGPEPEPTAPAARLPTWIDLTAGVSVGGAPPLVLGALAIAADVPLVENVRLVVGLGGAVGSHGVSAGTIGTGVADLGASIRFGGRLDLVSLFAGPSARGGFVVFSGSAAPAVGVGREIVLPWLGLGATLALGVRLGELPVRIAVEIEGGGIAVSATATALGSVAARLGEGWIEVRAGIGVAIE